MPAHSWATQAQLQFLNSKRVGFANAQNERKLPAFWPDIYQEFFAQWPDQASEMASTSEGTSKNKKKKASAAKTEDVELTHDDWVTKRKTVSGLINTRQIS
jgi:hypothetical protein